MPKENTFSCGCNEKKNNTKKCCICGCDCSFIPDKNSKYICKCITCNHKTQENVNNTSQQYLKHLKNVSNAVPIIDNAPPKLKINTILRSGLLVTDYLRLRQITKENKDLLRRINIINRSKGTIDSYNPVAGIRYSKIPEAIVVLKRYEKENLELLKHILEKPPTILNEDLERSWRHNVRAMQIKSKNPLILPGLVEKEFDVIEGVESLRKIPATFRQRVFIDLAIKNGRSLGRLVILLYSDLAPLTAQNFYDLCANYKKLKPISCNCTATCNVPNHFVGSPVHRIFPRLFAECGDITIGNGMGGISADGGSFPQENYAMEHKYTGTLAMIPSKDGSVNSKFTISFKPLAVLNHKRVAFGRVIRGINVLRLLESSGTNFGKPRDVITITNCGTLPFLSCRSCCTKQM